MTPSMQVPLGVQLRNENKLEDMGKILEELHIKCVPTNRSEGELTLPNGHTIPVDDTQFFQTLLGGDQLTVARVRGTVGLRRTHDKPLDHLDGILPVVEDWHARMTLMKVHLIYRHTVR